MMTSWAWSWDGGPAYAVHATLGSVIAHEILHAFDFHRRRLPMDPDLNVDEWLWITPNAWKRLEAKIECVARLYARSFWRKVQFYGNDVTVQVRDCKQIFKEGGIIGLLKISFLDFGRAVRLEYDEERERRGHRSFANLSQDLAHLDEREGPEPPWPGGSSTEPTLLYKRRSGEQTDRLYALFLHLTCFTRASEFILVNL